MLSLLASLPLVAPALFVPFQDDTPADGIPADGDPPITTDSGLVISMLAPGDATQGSPQRGDEVVVRYTGWLEDGTQFDSSDKSPDDGKATFRIGMVIEGWNEGLSLMHPGGRAKLTIPSDIAYGDQGRPPTIPAAATLIFDVELVEFESGPEIPAFQDIDDTAARALESGVRVQVLEPGTGESPSDNDYYTLDFVFFRADGTALEASYWSGNQLVSSPVSEQFPFLRALRADIKPGAKLLAEVPASEAFGERLPPGLTAESMLTWRIDVASVDRFPTFEAMGEENTLTSEKGYRYRFLNAGEGEACGQDGIFDIRYVIFGPNGEVVDSSYDPRAKGIQGSCSQMQLPLLAEIPALMSPGSVLIAEMPVTDFGPQAPPPLADAETCIWHLTMKSVSAPPTMPEFRLPATEGDNVVTTPSGLRIETLEKGSGPNPTRASRATVHYAGWLTDGELFDASYTKGQPSTFGVTQVIAGWTEALLMMNAGQTVLLYIPYDIAYGENGRPGIPGKADLVFQVELLSF